MAKLCQNLIWILFDRVYSFGIGQDVDRDLVREIARRGNGAFDFVDSFTNMNMEKKVLDMLDIAMKV